MSPADSVKVNQFDLEVDKGTLRGFRDRESKKRDQDGVATMTTTDVMSDLRSRIDPFDLKSMFPGDIADQIRKAVADMLRTINIESLTKEQRQAILDSVKVFYDTVLRPIDIPYIPAVVERFVDDWIWMSLESFLRSRLAL